MSKMTKSEATYQAIRARILRGELSPGYRLVMSGLAREFGVSAVPVREALRRLEAERLVQFEANVGARVTPLDPSDWEATMHALALLEGYSTALALPCIRPADLDRARATNADMGRAVRSDDPVAVTRLNRQFHLTLSERCPHAYLRELVRSAWDRLDAVRRSVFIYVPLRGVESVSEHDQLLDLIERGAPADEVEVFAREHKLRTIRSFVDYRLAAAPPDLATEPQ